MTPVAIYVRVSSRRQDYERQIRDLTEHASKEQYQVVATFAEKVSATKRQAPQRVELQKVLGLARAGKIRKVLVTEMSRIGRKLGETVQIVEELIELKVSVYAHNTKLETLLPNGRRNSPAMIMLMAFAEIAANEAQDLSDRVKSGQEAAVALGKVIGRPAGTVEDEAAFLARYPKVVRSLKKGASVRETASICGVSTGTVKKVRKLLMD